MLRIDILAYHFYGFYVLSRGLFNGANLRNSSMNLQSRGMFFGTPNTSPAPSQFGCGKVALLATKNTGGGGGERGAKEYREFLKKRPGQLCLGV